MLGSSVSESSDGRISMSLCSTGLDVAADKQSSKLPVSLYVAFTISLTAHECCAWIQRQHNKQVTLYHYLKSSGRDGHEHALHDGARTV